MGKFELNMPVNFDVKGITINLDNGQVIFKGALEIPRFGRKISQTFELMLPAEPSLITEIEKQIGMVFKKKEIKIDNIRSGPVDTEDRNSDSEDNMGGRREKGKN